MREETKDFERIKEWFESRIDNSETLLAKCAWVDVRNKFFKDIEQYVIKARIENLEWLCDHSTTVIENKCYDEFICKKDMRELIVEIKKGLK